MKKRLLTATLAVFSFPVFAVAPGGPSCGWGNLLFDGSTGTPSHVVAYTTNGTSGNATFGMTTGTNGCNTSAPLSYRGDRIINVSFMMDELSEDMARGNGEALNAVAVMIGIDQKDRERFTSVTHRHFRKIFPQPNVTAEQVVNNLAVVMKNDAQLSRYITS